MLKTERNTPLMGKRVRRAAAVILGAPESRVATYFEHGQWWVEDQATFAQYSVVDAEGLNTFDGFDLEMVSDGGNK